MPNLESLKNIVDKKNIFITSVVVFVLLAITNLVGTNFLATEGFVVGEYETKIATLEKENRKLSVMIEEETSIISLEEIAMTKGYVATSNIVFAPANQTVALR